MTKDYLIYSLCFDLLTNKNGAKFAIENPQRATADLTTAITTTILFSLSNPDSLLIDHFVRKGNTAHQKMSLNVILFIISYD